MELWAVIHALDLLNTNQYPVHIYSDSKYVIDAIQQRIQRQKKRRPLVEIP
jgi:ribonuclease HI